MNGSPNVNISRSLIVVALVIVLGFLTYSFLRTPDQRTFTDRVGDAFHALPQGVNKASEQLEDRTPGQKLGDAIKDTGDKVKDNTSAQ
jgi:multisubunit Na+/H+ antiporter MnhB subunit